MPVAGTSRAAGTWLPLQALANLLWAAYAAWQGFDALPLWGPAEWLELGYAFVLANLAFLAAWLLELLAQALGWGERWRWSRPGLFLVLMGLGTHAIDGVLAPPPVPS